MEKNYLNRVVWVVLAVVLVLLALYWLPKVTVGQWSMRKIDILADLRSDSASLANGNSTARKKAMPNVPMLEGSYLTHDKDGNVITVEDSIVNAVAMQGPHKDGVESIVDMSAGGSAGMETFYSALDSASKRPVRIAVLGDSYIESDLMTAMLRELLQERFGGTGCGYVPITSMTAKSRVTLHHSFEGWEEYKAIEYNRYQNSFNTITGNYFTASRGAWVNMVGSDYYYSRTATCTNSSFYYMGETGQARVSAYINGGLSQQFVLDDYSPVAKVTVKGDTIKSVKWVVNDVSGMVFLGASMDCDKGVIVDNFGMRSARGLHLNNLTERNLAAFHKVRPYDLIIIMYGLNIAGKGKTDKDFIAYCNEMTANFEKMKRTMPSTSFLLVGCSDRAERRSDGFHTMGSVLALIQAQKRVAINSRISFWNLYEAMGGEGSIVNMVNNGEAARDYTHVTRKGSDRIAHWLYNALMLGYNNR